MLNILRNKIFSTLSIIHLNKKIKCTGEQMRVMDLKVCNVRPDLRGSVGWGIVPQRERSAVGFPFRTHA